MSYYDHHADEWFETGRCSGGSFLQRLFDLCAVADGENLDRLREAFPAQVGAWVNRQRGTPAPPRMEIESMGLVRDGRVIYLHRPGA